MTPTDRRTAMRTFILLALAPMGVLGFGAARARAATPLVVPEGPLVLRRTIERALGETATLTVKRAWECSFVSAGGGVRVEGRQIAVTVDAPPSSEPLAQIERSRTVDGLFPAELDANGRFVESGTDAPVDEMHRAIDAALAVIRASSLEEHVQSDARQFLANLGMTAAKLVSTVQPDLFYPVEGTNSLERELPLAHGMSGTLEVEWSARAQHTGLLECTEKRIVTRVEGSARLARECWELSAA